MPYVKCLSCEAIGFRMPPLRYYYRTIESKPKSVCLVCGGKLIYCNSRECSEIVRKGLEKKA